jgi:hypothetical protein
MHTISSHCMRLIRVGYLCRNFKVTLFNATLSVLPHDIPQWRSILFYFITSRQHFMAEKERDCGSSSLMFFMQILSPGRQQEKLLIIIVVVSWRNFFFSTPRFSLSFLIVHNFLLSSYFVEMFQHPISLLLYVQLPRFSPGRLV